MTSISISSFISLVFLGIALSMDASAVSIVYGTQNKPFSWKTVLIPSACFALAQAVMPCIGWLGGELVADFVKSVDHWIAFILLLIIGTKFILDSRKESDAENVSVIKFWPLLLASLATSIDACVVGVTINFAHDPLLLSIVIIGVMTFIDTMIASLAGAKLGEKLGDKLGNKLLIVGGVVLILLGTKILISDLFF